MRIIKYIYIFYEENNKEIIRRFRKMKTQTFFVTIDMIVSDLTKTQMYKDKIILNFIFDLILGIRNI